MDKFPNYVRLGNSVNGTEMIKLYEFPEKAHYYRPAGQWDIDVNCDLEIFPHSRYNKLYTDVRVYETTEEEFLKGNEYYKYINAATDFGSKIIKLIESYRKSNNIDISYDDMMI